MGGDPKSQIWLTSVLTDDDVSKALTLCFSLKRVMTSRKVGVVFSPKISNPLKEALHQGFDFVFFLEDWRNSARLKEEEFVKVFSLSLKPFEKCVFLTPTMMAIKNCDEIFDEYQAPHGFLWTKAEGMDIFMVEPSLQTFHEILGGLFQKNGTGMETYLRNWTSHKVTKSSKNCGYLAKKYNRLISPQTLTKKDVSIVNLVRIPVDADANKFGLLDKLILQHQKRVYRENVQPLLKSIENLRNQPETVPNHTLNYTKEPIAIVGMSCRYPSANNLDEFWQLLANSEDGTGFAPEYRWLRELVPIKHHKNSRKTQAGFLRYPVEEFDAKFFGISPLEMEYLDPQTRLLHELVWEGLEDAAVNPQSLRGTNGGVFMGSWTNDYKDLLTLSGDDDFYRKYMGNSIGAAAARLSFLLGMTGPSIATESGCSSAMVAAHLACRSLQLRETNFAIVGGVNLLLGPFDKDIMPSVIAKDGKCKTFDAKADGFVRAEGCGVLVLKRLSDAVRDGDKVWSLIRGSGMTQEGTSKSMGTPTVHSETLAMKMALADANVKPEQISYVEAHGTGTAVGDPMEMAAIAKAYHSKERKEPLVVGSVKTNVGHTESCSGITGIMKVVLAMQHEIIPSHRNFETLNPAINLDAVPSTIPLKPLEWKRTEGKPRLAGVSSFGITGTDAHAIIEESPSNLKPALETSGLERHLHIMKISAKTEEAMNILVKNYKNLFSTTKETFANLSHTANVGRADFNQRAVIVASTNEEAIRSIDENTILQKETDMDGGGEVCFLFTGQGSQYPGMGKKLYETSPVFRIHFEYCSKILKEKYNIDITQVLWSEDKSAEVSRTIYSQTSIFCLEYALLKLWESWGVKADYALGHSLGEFAAAVCAGILSVEDAIKLVAERSRLIDDLSRGKMLVIKTDKQKVDTLMTKFASGDQNKMLDYAAINSSDQTVVAGDSELITQFSEYCKQSDLKCIVLDATHAFHSKHMDPMLDEYRKVAETVKGRNGNDCKFISGMRGSLLDAGEIDAEYWVQHTREKVCFMDASKKAVELGCKTFIEIGPQPVLSALTMMNNDTKLVCLPSLRKNENEWETLLGTLAKLYLNGMEIDWKGFNRFYNRSKVSLPHYPFIGKRYWPDMTTNSGVSIHPLLGTIIPNASSSKLFQTGLNLKDLEWVKDHAIGDHVIFPGAGYLEMCLAAGLATIETFTDSLSPPTRPMKVENLLIEAPLALQETTSCQIQTVTELNEADGDWNDISIKIFRKITSDLSGKWQPHAKATFSPLPTAEEKETSALFSKKSFLETLERETNDWSYITQAYEKLASVGLKFGPTFKSIERIWRNEEKKSLVAKIKVPFQGGSQSKFIIHPVVLDAMIQSLIMLRPLASLKRSLYVPIKIGKFVWLSSPSEPDSDLYIHAVEQSSSSCSSILVDAFGTVLAIMSGVDLIDTTVKAVESVLEQQGSSLPDFWEEIWKPSACLTQLSVDNEAATREKFYTDEFHSEFHAKWNIPSESVSKTWETLEKFVYLNCLRGLYEIGWSVGPLHSKFTERNLIKTLGITEGYFHNYFGFILQILEDEGIVQKSEAIDEWILVKIPPSHQQILEELNSPIMKTELISQFLPTALLSKVGESLGGFLSGSLSPLPVLFPEGNKAKEYPSIAEFYTHYATLSNITESFQANRTILGHFASSQTLPFTLRVLEIGAGTGSYSNHIVENLQARGINFEYTYTDISASFFPAAEKTFEEQLSSFKFKKLNIEEDPIGQGFAPEYFDLVIAAEVIHATKDIRKSLTHIQMLMKPRARLVIQETTRRNRVITYLFGTLEGYWRFQDFELRKNHCTLEKEEWCHLLEQTGLPVEGVFSVFEDRGSCIVCQKEAQVKIPYENKQAWLVFHHPGENVSKNLLENIQIVPGRTVILVWEGAKFENQFGKNFTVRRENYEDFVAVFSTLKTEKVNLEGIVYCWALTNSHPLVLQEEILQPYFHLTKALLSFFSSAATPRLVLLTNETLPLEDNDLDSFPASSLWGYSRSMKNESFHLNIKCVDVQAESTKIEDIFHELWNSYKENQIVFRGNSRYVPKLTPHKPVGAPLKLPRGTDRFQLILPKTKSISDLVYGPLDPITLGDEDVEVQVKATALNFRDVFSVLKPTEFFNNINSIGFDYSGVVKRVGRLVTKYKVGDPVMSCNSGQSAMPSHVHTRENHLLPLPSNMSFCEAATITAVYMTSVLGLLDMAEIKKEDVVLLHSASGGVGLSAIEICKSVGCTIIATAGSKRKHSYLRSLGVHHVFHSRNTNFSRQILELTNGHGVDVVLNSLTSEGFKEATLNACAKGARFIEMSKLNIWQKEDVQKLRADVKYDIICIGGLPVSEWERLLFKCDKLRKIGLVKPIPYVKFDALHIRDALEYMQKAKHIGKIVCVLPELRNEGGKIQIYTPIFEQQGTYLITGGLGGIGFVVCQWMIEKGAKHVILAGRSPPTSQIINKINEMNERGGSNVVAVQLDVGDFEQCRELLRNKIGKLNFPPLKGVMHAAGTLADGTIVNLQWEKLASTFATKINGTLNLHELTKDLNLDYFVVFSSIASLFGPAGQCNHAAANAFEDAFAHYRNSIGLPATTINWGQWGEVGVAKEVDLPGMKMLSNQQGMSGLEYALKKQRTQTCIMNMDSFLIFSKIIPQMAVYLDERIWNASTAAGGHGSGTGIIKSAEFWQHYDAMVSKEEKESFLKRQLTTILQSTLKLDKTEVISENASLQDMGVDSLMFIGIKNNIQVLMGDRLEVSTSAIKDCNTLNLLVSMLLSLIERNFGNQIETTKPTFEQVSELILKDCHLPENISAKETQKIGTVAGIRTVLITGSTGTLGPYVLKELTNVPQISKIICLIRPRKTGSLEENLVKNLKENELAVNMSKIECVAGNVALPHLGMDGAIWEKLSEEVDAIFHCAAFVDHTEHYVARESQSDMRAVNVGGIKNVLEFACESKLKFVYHTSSLGAVFTLDGNRLSERWPEAGEFDGIATFAYWATKFVGDMLLKQGVDRGIPCKSFRFPFICGDSKSGRCSAKNNHILMRYFFIMKTGIMPSTPMPMMLLPVDVCADVSVRLFFEDNEGFSDIYNVIHGHPDIDQEFVNVAAKFGYKVDIVDESEFTARVQNAGGADGESALALFKDIYDEDTISTFYRNAPMIQKWLEGGDESKQMWLSEKITKFIPNFYESQKSTMEYVYKDLSFCKSQGWFEKFGL